MLRYTIPILLFATYGLQAQPRCAAYQVKVDIQLGKGSSANPDLACVARGGQVRWCSKAGNWIAHFPSDQQSPFPPGHAKHGGANGTCSHWDQVRACAGPQPCRYKYTSRVDPSPPIDPHVEVEP